MARTTEQDEGSAAEHDAGSLVGTRIGNFKVERLIGEGAMGSVYLGVHETIDRRVAIKVLRPQLAEREVPIARFIDEARSLSRLGHPGLVPVFDFGTTDDGHRYFLMEYVEGRTLEELLRGGPLDPMRVVDIAAQIAAALSVAHQAGVIHRDLKPANLILVPVEDELEVVKVLDFGIAKLVAEELEGSSPRTLDGNLVGTPQYMAPEQARGRATIDGRADVYSLGALMYEALAGKPPFQSKSVLDLLVAHASKPAPPLDKIARGVPPALAALVMRCLEKDPARRPASMDALTDELVEILGHEPRAWRVGGVSRSSLGGFSRATASGEQAVPRRGTSPEGGVPVVTGLVVGIAVAGLMAALSFVVVPEEAANQAAVATAGAAGAAPAPASPAGPPSFEVNPYRADSPEALSTGAALYASKCARCHGASGEGDGSQTPPGLTPAALRGPQIEPGLLDVYRYEVVRRGIEAAGEYTMPEFGTRMSEDEIWRVVAYVAKLTGSDHPLDAETMRKMAVPSGPVPDLDNADLLARGDSLYGKHCERCHGENGRGDGPARHFLGRPPADLSVGNFKLRSTVKGSPPTDADIFRTLTVGMGMGGMPAFGKLAEADRWALVARVKAFAPAAAFAEAGQPIEITPRPRVTADAVRRGHESFRIAGCTKCHGEQGQGDGPLAGELVDIYGNEMVVPDLRAPYLFIGGEQPEDIYRTIMTGLNGTPMPAGDDFFNPEDVWNVVAWLESIKR